MPFDALTGPTADLLRKNFEYWVDQWKPCIHPNPTECFARQIATTTTFAAESPIGAAGPEYPYRAILFDDEALLSNQELRKLGRVVPGADRAMGEARAVKLDYFVFAYLGVHDPYYAKHSGRIFAARAFGVFLGVDLDEFPNCNATRRDLAASPGPVSREFLLPEDGRTYAHYLTANDANHKNDFWHYWGSFTYWMDPKYQREHWTWKIEFHYKNRVPTQKMEAILWPVETAATRIRGAGHGFVDAESKAEIREFRKRNPNVWVVPYAWDSMYHTFVKASYATVAYVLKHGTYPLHADVGIAEL